MLSLLVEPDKHDPAATATTVFHVPVKPVRVTEPSDLKVTLRKPVVDV
jgi:hypothetical protein